jgi:hypothetical protein
MTNDAKRYRVEVLKDDIARYKEDVKRDKLTATALLLGGTIAATYAGVQMAECETAFAKALSVFLAVVALYQGTADTVQVIRKQKKIKELQAALLELQKQLQK